MTIRPLIPSLKRIAVIAVLLALPASMMGQPQRQRAQTQTIEKKPITHDVYNTWKSIQGTRVSADGAWSVHSQQPPEGDGILIVRNLKTGSEFRQERGQGAAFSADSGYVAFFIAPYQAEVDQARKERRRQEEMPKNSLGIMNLANGQVETVSEVRSFRFADEGGSHLAYLMERLEERREEGSEAESAQDMDQRRPGGAGGTGSAGGSRDTGTDLVLRELRSGTTEVIKEVVAYAWNKAGSLLVYSVNSRTSADNGAFAWRASDGNKTALLQGPGKYQSLLFDDSGQQVAFLSDRDDAKAREEAREAAKDADGAESRPAARPGADAENTDPVVFKLYLWRAGAAAAREIVAPGTAGLPSNWNVSEHGSLSFSKDGRRLFLGTAPIPEAPPKDAPDPLRVDIWHWQDPVLQTTQTVRAQQDRNRSYRAVFHIDNSRLVQLANEEMAAVQTNDNARFALGTDEREYQLASSWDAAHRDIYAVDLQTGSRRLLFKAQRFAASLSPGGSYALVFDAVDQKWLAASTSQGSAIDLTGSINAVFYNEESDTPEPPRPYGIAGWAGGDSEVLLYDKYDIWAINPSTGASRMITQGHGRRQDLVMRYSSLDPDEQAIPTDRPMLLSATNDGTKATGYFRVSYQGGEPQRLIYADKLYSGTIKAKNADVVVFTQQSYTEFPDLWTSSLDFSRPQKITDANPQQSQYRWGTQEIIEYTNSDGKVLKALLAKPEGFDPSKKYPMMVYIYEGMTNGQNRYVAPALGQNINVTRFVSNGYVVLRPDIVYETGLPGMSAMKCVLPAIEQVAAQGYIDRGKIGIQGHSWGGYQITYLITQTNIFAAVQAGASVTNMISAYGGIRYGTGLVRQFQYERTQSRIGGTPWSKPLYFIENSPIFYADRVQTPYMTIHNDQDDAVPFTQGIEFFTALRRLGKEAYLFNYNGQLHGLRDREGLKHFTLHMCEFFDHYLLDAPRPEWMISPTPYLERGKRDISGFFKGPSDQQ